MKTSKKWLSGLLMALLFVSCTWEGDDAKHIDSRLRGTWESTDTSLYSGKLEIGWDTITITGYSDSQTPWPLQGKDDRQPFRGLAKNAPYSCYTENSKTEDNKTEVNKLFIKTVGGDPQSFQYVYTSNASGKYLYFKFGNREEALRHTED